MKFDFLTTVLVICTMQLAGQTKYPPRPDRAHSFFGVHFDFHADEDCKEIGKRVDEEMISYVLDQVKPDFIQIDCKGHAGYSSYPTKVGNPAPGFTKDPLKLWRKVTAEKGVALFMHYSGVYDMRALQLHPSWAAVNAEGELSNQYTSVFGPYSDSLMIPQFKELSGVYGVDGVWVDGDCWGTQIDYSPEAKKLFTTKTGITQIPLKPGEANWNKYVDFNRQGFRDYLLHYVNELHHFNPIFQIASNWAYSTFMPEDPKVPVDFISGDFSATNSMNSARFEGRFIRNQGKPWDLMAWGFSWVWNQRGTMSLKSAPQIQRETASVLSLGGGVQVYMRQQRDGSIHQWTIPVLGEVSKFVRARQPWCQNAEAVPQIGLILSSEVYYDRTGKPFNPYDPSLQPMHGILENLLSSQKVVDIVAEHHLDNIDKYPMLIYPEWDSIVPAFKNKLLEYVSRGGRLLLIGPKTAALFKEQLNVKFSGNPKIKTNGLVHGDILASVQSLSQSVNAGEGVRTIGKYYPGWDMDEPSEATATITKYGKGEIGAVYLNIGEAYLNRYVPVMRDFLDLMVHEMFPDPDVEVTGSHYVDVTLNKVKDKLVVNLVNALGPHENENILVHDEIPPLTNLKVSVKYPVKPNKVMLQPSNTPLLFTYRNGSVSCKINKVEIHEMVVIE